MYQELIQHYKMGTPSNQEILALIEAINGCRKILIVGIGCGRILLALLEYFKIHKIICEIHAVEYNLQFVDYCRNDARLDSVTIHHCSFLDFPEETQYDAVCMPFTVILTRSLKKQKKWVRKALRLSKKVVIDLLAEPYFVSKTRMAEVRIVCGTKWEMLFCTNHSSWYVRAAKATGKCISSKKITYFFMKGECSIPARKGTEPSTYVLRDVTLSLQHILLVLCEEY